MDEDALEEAFRTHAQLITEAQYHKHISLDGKTIRGSFDSFEDQKAIQVFSALFNNKIILAHKMIEGNKTNEIPRAQELTEELGLSNHTFTFDATHCQKKRCKY